MKRRAPHSASGIDPVQQVFSTEDLVNGIFDHVRGSLPEFSEYIAVLLCSRWLRVVMTIRIRKDFVAFERCADRILRYFDPIKLDLRNASPVTASGIVHLTRLEKLYIDRYNTESLVIALPSLAGSLTRLVAICVPLLTNKQLKLLTGLVSLDLTFSQGVSDAGLSHLTRLTDLNLHDQNTITKRSLLRLTNLTSLSLKANTKITAYFLERMTGIRFLNLDWNHKITDRCLMQLTNLTELSLSGNQLVTLSGVIHLTTQLKHLSIAFSNKVTNECLARFTALRSLNLLENEEISYKTVALLTNITRLVTFNSRYERQKALLTTQ